MTNEHTRWNEDSGDVTHRINYDLDCNSVIFDVGGYKGDWAHQIYSLYKCYIFIFEPVEEYYLHLVEKFKNNKKIKVFQFGLLDKTSELKIYNNYDSSSIYRETDKTEIINVVSFNEFVQEHKIQDIDLMKINIEGGEYALLLDVINNEQQSIIKNIQIQFHDFMDDHEYKRDYIHKQLIETHHLTYNYKYVWENWTKNNI